MWDWVFDGSLFTVREHCGIGWTRSLILWNQASNFLIFLSYMSIPLSLAIFCWDLRCSKGGRGIRGVISGVLSRDRWVLLLFATFIFACGLTHLNDVIVFQYAPYRYFTAIDILTAVFSLPTAVLLPRVARKLVDELTVVEGVGGDSHGGDPGC